MSSSNQTRVSVAMCTYDGERFLSEQLASIARQTRLPDEVILCDDGSTDRTLALLREFAATASFTVRIFENEHNLGYAANFEQAIRLCGGELIALSDQDDIWYPNRLERSELEFRAHPEIGLVFSDADLIDEQGTLLGQTIFRRLGFAGKRKRDLLAGRYVVLAKHRFVTGATVMFRASLRDRFLPIGPGWIHDEWIVMIVAAFCGLLPIDQPLIRYRVHASQQVGFQNKLELLAKGSTRAEKHFSRLAESVAELKRMCDTLEPMVSDRGRGVLQAYRDHLKFLIFRSTLPASRVSRLGAILRRSASYRVHASGLLSMGKDLLLRR